MALVLLARALVRPGDLVAVEQPGYRPAWEAFKLAGAAVMPIPSMNEVWTWRPSRGSFRVGRFGRCM
jgi:DNA-binding transcriptional MocR family regulator